MHSTANAPPLTLALPKPRGFSLQAAADFYAGFVPGSGMAVAATDRLTLAFRLDQSFEAVAVQLRETRDRVIADVAGTGDTERVAKQVARMLGLEADGAAWLEIGRRDPVVGKLQREFPGFFTAAKSSPYDAAAWGVISPRMNMRAAAKLKLEISARAGDRVELFGRAHVVFPSPAALLALRSFPGLPAIKLERLHGVARAALEGKLDAERLRALPVDTALAQLQELPGVGPWTASHILFRGAALRDAVPTVEPRLLHGLAAAYSMVSASPEHLLELAEGWRPFRMWVCVLLARHLANVGGWHQPGLVAERAALGRISRTAPSAASRDLEALAAHAQDVTSSQSDAGDHVSERGARFVAAGRGRPERGRGCGAPYQLLANEAVLATARTVRGAASSSPRGPLEDR